MLGKDLLGIRDLEVADIMNILNRAEGMKGVVEGKKEKLDILKGKSAVTLFYENSTRTRMAFTMAGTYLGASVVDLGIAASSVKKGESLVDTGITLDRMGIDFMIMRNSYNGAPHLLARNVSASVINAGDGFNEHPTQALLDFYTIREKKGGFKNLKVTIIGDIAHSRVARSDVFGLNKLGAKVTLAGPGTLTSQSMAALGCQVTNDLKAAVKDADVIIALRIQLERMKGGLFPNLREYSQIYGIDQELFSLARPDAFIMHPAPVNRGVELVPELMDSDVSMIDKQVTNGVAVRMAVLALLQEGRA